MAYYRYKRKPRKRPSSSFAKGLSKAELETALPSLRREAEKLRIIYEHAEAENSRREAKDKEAQERVKQLIARRTKLRNAPESLERKQGLLFSRMVLKQSVVEQIASISCELGEDDPERPRYGYGYRASEEQYVDPNGEKHKYLSVALTQARFRYFRARKELRSYESALAKILSAEKKKAEASRKAAEQKRRVNELRALSAQVTGEGRKIAAQMKKQLTKSKKCPYCTGSLDESHVDHIYPLSKGGLSVESNLLFVCSECNIRKKNLTLRAFVVKYGLNREAIEKRLLKLGKDV